MEPRPLRRGPLSSTSGIRVARRGSPKDSQGYAVLWTMAQASSAAAAAPRMSGRGDVRKTIAVLGSALFFAVAPSVLAALIPWSITHWEFRPPFFDLQATRAVGMLLIAAGLPGLIDSFARFALQGLGTPAPIAPPQSLVVTGLYCYVRNPMYIAVVAVILGQGILFG